MSTEIVSLVPLNECGPESPQLRIIRLQCSQDLSNGLEPETEKPNYPSEVFLGRNQQTLIRDCGLSRQICKVIVERDELSASSCSVKVKLQMQKPPGLHCITVNGKPVTLERGEFILLHDGYVIGVKQYQYLYRVSISTSEPSPVVPINNDLPSIDSPPKRLTQRQVQAQEQMREEMICGICMEILVGTTAFHPCGHLFCKSCSLALDRCPSCRKNIRSRLPMKQVDGLILNMVKLGGIFEVQDAYHFIERSGLPFSDFEWVTNDLMMPRGLVNNSDPASPSKRKQVSSENTFQESSISGASPPRTRRRETRPGPIIDIIDLT